MTAPMKKRHLKAKGAPHEVSAAGVSTRFAKLKKERGALSASAEGHAHRVAGGPWAKRGS